MYLPDAGIYHSKVCDLYIKLTVLYNERIIPQETHYCNSASDETRELCALS